MKKYGVPIIGIILLVAVIFCGRYYFTHNKSYKNEAIEKGDYNPTIQLCRSICKVLGKTLDELFWEEE